MLINKCINPECDNDENCLNKPCIALHELNGCEYGKDESWCICIARSTYNNEMMYE